jgi:hypothetical protein
LKPRKGLATESVSAGLRLALGGYTTFQVNQLQSLTNIRSTSQRSAVSFLCPIGVRWGAHTLSYCLSLRCPKRGVKLGGKREGFSISDYGKQGRSLSLKARRAKTAAWASDLLPVVRDIQGQGATSLRRVATVLNDRGIPTRRGGQWTAVQVQRLLAVI